ncbi:uncharacterized protein LOC132699092 [Cylas formicarius]|uniref:uncharacterized protein LOC132699092 n=1 Tax=Cylas formicarius TaxID=197179 RepID=UPI002958C982|nr:uncharacterized protein LOC132699092 [Cylas formicarius]
MNAVFENELLKKWLTDMQSEANAYQEPMLEEYTVSMIKIACNTFRQDFHVFCISADILEKYIHVKNVRGEKIKDPLLLVCAAIFVTSKYSGGGADLKLPIIGHFLKKLTGKEYDLHLIMLMEQDVLHVLNHMLPVTTQLDDFNVFLENCKKQYRLKLTIRPLCLEIMQLMYLEKKIWFNKLKQMYKNELKIFHDLMCSKFFLPEGILIAAFQLTHYQYILDINGMLQDLMKVTNIHPDHVLALSAVILHLIRD